MVRMVSRVSVEINLLGHSKMEHRSGSNRFQCYKLSSMLTNPLLTLTQQGCYLNASLTQQVDWRWCATGPRDRSLISAFMSLLSLCGGNLLADLQLC